MKETKKDRAVIEVLKTTHIQTRRISAKVGRGMDDNADNLDLAINAFIRDHQVDHNDEHSSVNQQSTIELDEMMRVLEEHMLHSNMEMVRLEEELTDRYVELEELAEDLTEEEYMQELDILEEERLKLEEEKLKLQDHFELRLNSIKSRQAEMKARYDSAKEASLSISTSNSLSGQSSEALLISNTSMNASSSSRRGVSQQPRQKSTAAAPALTRQPPLTKKTKEEALKKRAEGWINLTTKGKFFNQHFKAQHERSDKKLKEQWEPEILKNKKFAEAAQPNQKIHQNDENHKPNQNSQNQKFQASLGADKSFFNLGGSSNFDFHQGLSALDNELAKNDPTQGMFNRFRLRLLEVSNRWDEIQSQGKARDSIVSLNYIPLYIYIYILLIFTLICPFIYIEYVSTCLHF